jgi:hypothetical protein
VEQFSPRALATVADIMATHPTDRAAAELAITAHLKACRPWSAPPLVTWCSSPDAALNALSAANAGYGNVRRDLRDRPLFDFDQEATVRLSGSVAACQHAVWSKGRGTAVRDAVGRLPGAALGHEIQRAVLDMITARSVQPGFDYMGLIADHPRLAFYEFLKENGADLPDIVATFCAMTSSVWLMFPVRTMIFAVDRPVTATADQGGLTLIFSDSCRLSLPRSAEE